jgi:transposase
MRVFSPQSSGHRREGVRGGGLRMSLLPTVRVFVATAPCDLRKQFDGLAVLVDQGLRHDPPSGHLFVVFNRRVAKQTPVGIFRRIFRRDLPAPLLTANSSAG